ncbi:hypothetical protein [Streptomyces sp. FIT100]|uniref:hypothetical protein n=1 Tax=Streptomyces sp. FIT100 TaxID=2837956 RepID=UPI0021C58F46|nr:hypothetical protein [Streptomyces sp. FIT100]UUN27179.1 hypothetical protein KK483_12780 [Streptomyces sp. FIT100]
MENWRENARTGHTHDPNEVTVQIDGLGRQLSELRTQPNAQEGSDGPVFVDESGRRSKKFRRIGWILALACAGYAVTLVIALIGGNSNAPSLLIPGGADEEATTVEVSPAPVSDASATAAPAEVTGAPSPSGAADLPSGDPAAAAGEPGTDARPSASADAAAGADTSTGAGNTGGATDGPQTTASSTPGTSAGDAGGTDATGGTGASGGSGGEQPSTSPAPSTTPTETGPPIDIPGLPGGRQLAGEGTP